MNRLILIGNGFDLAHGLKTSYKDFIFWYLADCLERAGGYPHKCSDTFIDVYPPSITYVKSALNVFSDPIFGEISYLEFIQEHYNRNSLLRFLNCIPANNYTSKPIDKNEEYDIFNFRVEIKSSFLGKLLCNCVECGWVDIEQEYFDQLKACKNEDGLFITNKVNELNNALRFLAKKLEEYLILQDKLEVKVHHKLLQQFVEPSAIEDFDMLINRQDLMDGQLNVIAKDLEQVVDKAYVLNFNYTNTFQPYLQTIHKREAYISIEENHIHGQLNNSNNPLIFGFGDEQDKDYLSFEEHRSNDLFTHVKSYHYIYSPNYRNLMRFLNSGYYQVFVVGHSCGLSDRTMFKTIFDHENCKSVRIFHYTNEDGKNDFFDKSISLGRHFTDKGRMRRLIVNFNEDDTIPQYSKENSSIQKDDEIFSSY